MRKLKKRFWHTMSNNTDEIAQRKSVYLFINVSLIPIHPFENTSLVTQSDLHKNVTDRDRSVLPNASSNWYESFEPAFSFAAAAGEKRGQQPLTGDRVQLSDSADVFGSLQAATTERVRGELRGHIQRAY